MKGAKPLTSIMERVSRCGFCGREVEHAGLGHEENPLCAACLPERMAAARRALGDVGWRVDGEYVEFFTEGDRTPR